MNNNINSKNSKEISQFEYNAYKLISILENDFINKREHTSPEEYFKLENILKIYKNKTISGKEYEELEDFFKIIPAIDVNKNIEEQEDATINIYGFIYMQIMKIIKQ